MADEARVTSSLTVVKRDSSGLVTLIDHQTRPSSFTADVDGSSGPYGGTIVVPLTGIAVALAAVGSPGLCRIFNQDASNYVLVGVHDGVSFFPLLELLPGESYALRLYRFLGSEFVGTGTPADVNNLWLQAMGAECKVLVEIFPK